MMKLSSGCGGSNEEVVVRGNDSCGGRQVLRFNLVRVEIRELRPEVVAESDEVLVHY